MIAAANIVASIAKAPGVVEAATKLLGLFRGRNDKEAAGSAIASIVRRAGRRHEQMAELISKVEGDVSQDLLLLCNFMLHEAVEDNMDLLRIAEELTGKSNESV